MLVVKETHGGERHSREDWVIPIGEGRKLCFSLTAMPQRNHTSSLGLPYQLPQIEWLKTTVIYSFTVLEARSLESMLSGPLSRYHSACVQVTFILLNNATFTSLLL